MKKILILLKNVIENIQQYIPEETIEEDSDNYLITNKNQIERRENSLLKKTKAHLVNKILGEELKSTGDGFTKTEIAQKLFLFTFYPFWILYIADIYMYITKSYKDGNGIPLV